VSLSVIVVTYRTGEELAPLLDGLAAQREPSDQVIVVDNASGDGTAALAGRHHAVDAVVETGANLGFAAGCNAGAAVANGDVLLFLNPDAIPEPGALAALRSGPPGWDAWMGIVMLPDGLRVNTAGGELNFLGLAWAGRFGDSVEHLPVDPFEVPFLSGACLAIRRRAWDELGGFPEEYFMYHEDVELSLRLRLAGARFGALPAARVRHDYEFAKGSMKWRLLERNRWWTVLRTYPGPLLAAVVPLMVAAELPVLAVAARDGWWREKLRADLDVVRSLPRVIQDRRAVQSTRNVSVSAFAEPIAGTLDSPFFGTLGGSPVLRGIMGALWAAVRRILARC
jgi:GT2 family glycosyltransferase